MKTEEFLDFAVQFALAGGQHTLKYFRKSVEVIRKGDASPVTVADREAEWVIREKIQARFPDHGIIGEEHGRINEGSNVQWVLDPIDGTVSFIHGIPLYTTLIGVLVDGNPVAGVIYAPALDEMVDGSADTGTRLNGTTVSVRSCNDLSEATFITTDRKNIRKYGFDTKINEIMKRVRVDRTWGDAYGHMMVATGRADLMFDPILNIWDAAALLPVVQGAGGHFLDVNGEPDIHTGNGISVVSGIKDEVLNLLK
ncbi:MAG: inositol monophosphatase family protein [Bacteroidetes bacterium]|nr:inositol monophosphatase family protein [Bacteroidota bacterium]